jgi:hypothetical protein
VPKKKISIYNRVLKEFTKINNKLPEDRKLSIKDRRKIIKEQILPNFSGVPNYRIKVRDLNQNIFRQYDRIPPKEICDLNYIDLSDFQYVEWHSLDETISELVPDCVYIKVSAGQYGTTKIFNTRNYEYGRAGVRTIVEEIRPDADRFPSGRFIFTGVRKLRPRKRNNGTPENYYLDFVLFVVDRDGIEESFGDTESVEFELPKTREVRKTKTKVRKIIDNRIKALKSKKDSKRRAKKTLERNFKDLSKKAKRVDKSTKPNINAVVSKEKQFEKVSKLLDKYLKEGKLTQTQYDVAVNKLLKQMGLI